MRIPGAPAVKTGILAAVLLWSACSRDERTEAGPGQGATSETAATAGRDAPAQELVRNGDFDGPEGWTMMAVAVTGSTAVLCALAEAPSARLVQQIVGLEPNSTYVLCLRAMAEQTPAADLIVELTGDGYGGPGRRLRLRPRQLGQRFQTYAKMVQSSSPPGKVRLRISSRSAVPIVIDDVSLTRRK